MLTTGGREIPPPESASDTWMLFPTSRLDNKNLGLSKIGKTRLTEKSNTEGYELLFKCWSQRKHSAKCLLDVMTGSHFKARNDFDIKRMEQHNIVCAISE